MKYLTQAIQDATGDVKGDCWRTALACILELQRDEVPNFAEEYRDDSTGGWWSASVEFALTHGHLLADADPVFPIPLPASPHCIAIGPSPRGPFLHAVVVICRTGELVWDPHESRAGLAGPPTMVAYLARGAR